MEWQKHWNLRKQPPFCDTTNKFPVVWCSSWRRIYVFWIWANWVKMTEKWGKIQEKWDLVWVIRDNMFLMILFVLIGVCWDIITGGRSLLWKVSAVQSVGCLSAHHSALCFFAWSFQETVRLVYHEFFWRNKIFHLFFVVLKGALGVSKPTFLNEQ